MGCPEWLGTCGGVEVTKRLLEHPGVGASLFPSPLLSSLASFLFHPGRRWRTMSIWNHVMVPHAWGGKNIQHETYWSADVLQHLYIWLSTSQSNSVLTVMPASARWLPKLSNGSYIIKQKIVSCHSSVEKSWLVTKKQLSLRAQQNRTQRTDGACFCLALQLPLNLMPARSRSLMLLPGYYTLLVRFPTVVNSSL